MQINIHDLLLKFFGWIGVMLVPIQATMFSIGALIILDLVTGIWASVRRNEKISSYGIRRTVSKTLAYELAIIASYIMEQQFLLGIPVVRVVAGLIAATEFKSLLENITSITGLDLVQEFVKSIQKKKD
jgi:hypothetical protein